MRDCLQFTRKSSQQFGSGGNPRKNRQLKIYMKSTWLKRGGDEDVFLPWGLTAHSLFEIGFEAYWLKRY